MPETFVGLTAGDDEGEITCVVQGTCRARMRRAGPLHQERRRAGLP